jgi:hypothetical protein
MAQTTRSSSRSSSRGNSRTKSRSGSSGNARSSTARSSTRRSSSNASKTTASRRGSASASRRAQPNGTLAKAGGRAAELASKAKGPLLAGGAALAGIAGGVALKSRDQSQNRRPLKRLSSVQLPKSLKNIDLGKIDLDSVTEAGRKVRSIGEQVGDVVDAADKTRKKHK